MHTLDMIWILCCALCAGLFVSLTVRVGPRLRELADHNSKLLGALIMLEWSKAGRCPFCGATRLEGHFSYCNYREIFSRQKGYYGKEKTV